MTLYNHHRPKTFDQVVGQEAAVLSLQRGLKKGVHTYLLHGESGVGKTTLARIAARTLKCAKSELVEIDGATKTGIEDMREVTHNLRFKPLHGDVKVIILDECHALSAAAWKSLLKATEEPPDYVYWFLCTTELGKVLKAVKTRCLSLGLKRVSVEALTELLEKIKEEENFLTPSKVIALCAQEAEGSPRQAISNLEACAEAKNLDVAVGLLASASASPAAFELARALNQRAKWKAVQALLLGLGEANPESVRHVVRSYMTKVILGAKDSNQIGRAMHILEEFSTPFPSGDGVSPLVLACGRIILGERVS